MLDMSWLAREAFRAYRFAFGDSAEQADCAWDSLTENARIGWRCAVEEVLRHTRSESNG